MSWWTKFKEWMSDPNGGIMITAGPNAQSRVQETPRLKFKRWTELIPLPTYATDGAAGMDVRAADSHLLPARSMTPVDTGLFVEIPHGYEIQVRSRSGLAIKGIVVANSPGTIDEDYRGRVGVILHNTTDKAFLVERGDRIAQLVLAKYERLPIVEVDELSSTSRGSGGFGSTGVK